MPESHPFLLKMAKPVAKGLANVMTLGAAGDLFGETVDHALKGRIERAEERQIKKKLEAIGASFVRTLAREFEEFAAQVGSGRVSVEAVERQISNALTPALTAEFFAKNDLNVAKIETAIRMACPVPPGQFGDAETALYERALHHAVTAIVDTASKLKGFSSRATGEQLARLTQLSEGMDAVFATVAPLAAAAARIEKVDGDLARVESVVVDATKHLGRLAITMKGIDEKLAAGAEATGRVVNAEFAAYEHEYSRAIVAALDELELFGVDLTPEAKKQRLSVAYISLSLETPVADSEVGPTPVEHVLDAIGDGSRRLLLRGEAGSGKSTLLRWAAIRTGVPKARDDLRRRFERARRLTDAEVSATAKGSLTLDDRQRVWESHVSRLSRRSWQACVPFLILLRTCSDGALPRVDLFADATVPMFRTPPGGWMHETLTSGRALVLIDGIDEVPEKYRALVRKQLAQLVNLYPDCYYVVTTRPAAIEADGLADLKFREATIAPMSETDRGLLIDKWHEAVRGQILKSRGGAEAAKLDGMADRLKSQLRDNPPIARLATNPLMAAMVCALHRDRNQQLPDDLYELVEALCHMILYRRERESGLDLSEFDPEYRDLSYPQRKAILARLAEHLMEQELSAVSARVARDKIADALKRTKGSRGSAAPVILRGLIERSGILREKAPGMVDFIHNAFKEYLAAWRLVREHKARSLARCATSADWEHVLLFAAATPDDEGFATELIEAILPPDEASKPRGKAALAPEAVKMRARRLTAIRLRAVAQHLDPALDARLTRLAKSMLPPKSATDSATLAAIGDLAVPFLKFVPDMDERTAIACIRTLRLIGTDAARARLKEYACETRMGVIAELAQAMNPLEIGEVHRRVTTQGMQLPDGIRAQIVDLTPLRGKITHLNLWNTQVTDLAPLARMAALASLYLSESPVSDLGPLARLTALTSLKLNYTKVADLAPLAGLTALTSLELNNTEVADIAPLAGLHSLMSLSLRATPVAKVTPLASLTALTTLDLRGTFVEDVTPLAKLTALTSLDLHETRINDVTPLVGLNALIALDLQGTKPMDVAPLAKLPNLRSYLGPPIPGRTE
jgi:DNA-binding transcriptional ArsR family regulator